MAKKGAKGRKIGNKCKQPSMKRYTNEQRWIKNKRLAKERHAKRMAKKAKKAVARSKKRKLKRAVAQAAKVAVFPAGQVIA